MLLFAGFERQRFRKPYRDSAQAAMQVVHPADGTCADEIAYVEAVIRLVLRHTKAGGYVLAWLGAVPVGETGESGTSAANVHHLALREYSGKILGEPDGPVIPHPLLCSSLRRVIHLANLSKPSYPVCAC